MFKHAVHRLGFNIPSAQNARDDRLAEVSRVPLYGNLWEIDGLGSVKGKRENSSCYEPWDRKQNSRDPILCRNKVGINYYGTSLLR